MSLEKRTISELVGITQNTKYGTKHRMAALGVIYLNMIDPLIYHINRIVKNKDSARELANETFIRVQKYILKYKDDFKFSTWVFAIGRNLAIEHVRKKKNSFSYGGNHLEIMGGLDVPNKVSYNADYELNRQELARSINSAIENLPSEHKQVIKYRFLDGMSYKEIEEYTGKNINTLKTWGSRGRKHLVVLLGQHYH